MYNLLMPEVSVMSVVRIGIWDLTQFEIGILGFQDPPPLPTPLGLAISSPEWEVAKV